MGQKAIAAKDRAYCSLISTAERNACPGTDFYTGVYSKFRVGACLLTESGEYITGVNVENVSYPVGVCAERCAMGTAVV